MFAVRMGEETEWHFQETWPVTGEFQEEQHGSGGGQFHTRRRKLTWERDKIDEEFRKGERR